MMRRSKICVYCLLFFAIIVLGTGGFVLGFNTDIGITTSTLTTASKLDNFNNYVINNILMKTSKVTNDSTNIESAENILFEIIQVTNNNLEDIAVNDDIQQTTLQTNENNTISIDINNSTPITIVNNENQIKEESNKVIETSSLVDNEKVNINEEISQNPHTGISVSLMGSLIIIVLSINILKKKNLFNKI